VCRTGSEHVESSAAGHRADCREITTSSWILNSLFPSLVTCCAYRILGSTPVISFILYPILQVAVSSILGGSSGLTSSSPVSRMQSALSALYKIAVPRSAPPPPQESGCAGLLRQLVSNQERTMFYTVTVQTTSTSNKTVKPPTNLKWQCACALSRSQSVIRRTNSNSSQYYTITYMAEVESVSTSTLPRPPCPASVNQDEKVSVQEFSPVKIYINS